MPKKSARCKKNVKKQEKVVETASTNINIDAISPFRMVLRCSKKSSAMKLKNLNSSTADKSWDFSRLSDVYFDHIDSPPQITPSNLRKAKILRKRSAKGKNLNINFCRSAEIINTRAKSPKKKSPMKTIVEVSIENQDKMIAENKSSFDEQDNIQVVDMEETRIQTNRDDDERKSLIVNENSFIDADSETDLQFIENHYQEGTDECNSFAHSENVSKNNLFDRDKLINNSPIKTILNEGLCTDIIENSCTEEKCSESNQNQQDIFCKSSPKKQLNLSKESPQDNGSCKKNSSEISLSKSVTDQENSQNLLTEQDNLQIVVSEETNKDTEIMAQLINQDNILKESNINTTLEPNKANSFERNQTIKISPVKRPFNEGVIADKTKELYTDENCSESNQKKLDDCELLPLKLPKHSTELDRDQDNTSLNKSSPKKNSLNKNINGENNSHLFEKHGDLQIIDMEETKMKTSGENVSKLQCIINDNDTFKETNSVTESDNDLGDKSNPEDISSIFSDESNSDNSQNSLKNFITEVTDLLANSPVKKCYAQVISNSITVEPTKKIVCTDNSSENHKEQSQNCQKLDSNDLNKSSILVKGYNLRDRSKNKKNLKDSSQKIKQNYSSENNLSSSEQDYKKSSNQSKSENNEMDTTESECFSEIDISDAHKLEDSTSSITIGEHEINTSELTAKAVKSWHPPSHVMRKMMSLETKLLLNNSKFHEKLKKGKQKMKQSIRNSDEHVKKLLNNRWNEFCKSHKFNRKEPKYFYKNPITVHFFPNLLNYFNKFLSQDLPSNATVKSIQTHFRGLFEPVNNEYYSSYEDAIIMALRKRLQCSSIKEEVYLNYVASHALNRNVFSVSRRHTLLKKKHGLSSPKKKLCVKRGKNTSNSWTDSSETDEDTNAMNENRSRPLKSKFCVNKNDEQVKEKKKNLRSKNSMKAKESESTDQNNINENNDAISEDSNGTVRDQRERSLNKSSGCNQEETSADQKESNDVVCQDKLNEDNSETDESSYNSDGDKSKKKLYKCGVDRKVNSSDEEENDADESGIDEDYNIINEGLSDADQENILRNLDECGPNEEYESVDEEECVKDGDNSCLINGGQGTGCLEERIRKISEKSKTWISLLEAMLDVTGERRATAENLVDVDLSVKDWRWISSEVSNTTSQAMPAHIAKALYDSKLHPLMFASRSINNYKLILDIVYVLKKRDYSDWYEVKWSEISKEMDNLKPLFLFTTFVDFARLYVPLHIQSSIKECVSYLLTEKLPFIKTKIKDGITLISYD